MLVAINRIDSIESIAHVLIKQSHQIGLGYITHTSLYFFSISHKIARKTLCIDCINKARYKKISQIESEHNHKTV